jgi:hypothetical protein
VKSLVDVQEGWAVESLAVEEPGTIIFSCSLIFGWRSRKRFCLVAHSHVIVCIFGILSEMS